MRRGLLAFGAVVALAGGMVFGQAATEAPPAAPAPVAQVAAPTTAPVVRVNSAIVPNLSRGFQNRHTQFLEVAKAGNIDVLFMGDSITDWWRSAGRPPTTRPGGGGPGGQNQPPLPEGVIANAGKAQFDKYFGEWKVANFGIAGDTTQGVLWRLQNGEAAGYTPKAIMLMIGTNNTGRGNSGNTAEEIAMGVSAVVHEMRKTWPEAKILLLGIFPRSRPGDPVRTKIATINQIIATLHDEQHVWYMDISDKFLAPDGTIPRELMADGLHPTSKGYEVWAEAVKPTLEKLKQ